MKVLSYNILAPCYAHLHTSSYPSWDERKHLILERIEQLNPQAICLQEVEYKGFMFLDSQLREKGFRGIYAMKGFGKLEGLAIFFQFEELSFTGAETLFFHDYYPDKQTQIPFASGDTALFVYFKSPKGLVGIATTHIHAYFPEDNLAAKKTNQLQIQELFSVYIPERSYVDHWIIAGDFNTEAIPPLYQTRNHLLDAHASLPHPTFEDKKIDFIFHSDTLQATPIPLSPDTGSDHTPLLASLSFL